MSEYIGLYEDKFKAKKGHRIAVIMNTFIANGISIRDYKDGEALDWINDSLRLHDKFKRDTIPYDLYIVDNSSTYEPWLNRLKELKHFTRKNTGLSFGAFEYAFKKLKDEYDYFLFHEQDIAPAKAGWLDEILDKFLYTPFVGAVGGMVLPIVNVPGIRDDAVYLESAYTFTSTAILNECGIKIGHKKEFDSYHNEQLFTQPILEAGYRIIGFNTRDRVYCYGRNTIFGDERKDKLAPMVTLNNRDEKLKIIMKRINES